MSEEEKRHFDGLLNVIEDREAEFYNLGEGKVKSERRNEWVFISEKGVTHSVVNMKCGTKLWRLKKLEYLWLNVSLCKVCYQKKDA